MMDSSQSLQMRLFKLGWSSEDLADLYQVGRENFSNSIEKEAGTLAMLMGHPEQQATDTFVIEIYRDQAAYEEHIASKHFQTFADFAKEKLQGRDIQDLAAQYLVEKKQGLCILEENDYSLRLAYLTIREDKIADFRAIVAKEMEQAIALEDGVHLLYATSFVDQPQQWLFVEIYRDEAAYQRHCQTPHFLEYIEESKDLVIEKKLLALKADLLVSKGNWK